MKKKRFLCVLAIMALCAGLFAGCGGSSDSSSTDSSSSSSSSSSSESSSSTQQYTQNFKLNNATGVEIYGVYVSPVDTTNWGSDIMGQDTLADGSSVNINFSTELQQQYWDLMVTDSQGTQLIFKNLDLFSISEVTLKLDNGTPTAEVK
jgi:hypothetical protein